jgi:hypothetical protein
VADPRAPEWRPYMEGHERWWDCIWKFQAARGDPVSTMIAEHGPPLYQPCCPYSKQPLAHIWDVNHWISLRRQVRRYIHTYLHTYTHTLMHSYIHTYTHTYIHSCTHSYTHTYIPTYTLYRLDSQGCLDRQEPRA